MATNDFKAFAIGNGANVTSQEDYNSLPAITSGFTTGKASSAQINKAIRQATTMASLLGQFINAAGLDALDNGSVSTLLTSFNAALTKNLTLGTASKRDVGVSAGQIPDMASFSFGIPADDTDTRGYQRMPSGLIIQWGVSPLSFSKDTEISLPISFPNRPLFSVASDNGRGCLSIGTQIKNGKVIAFGSGKSYDISGNLISYDASSSIRCSWLSIGY